jgi:hypothetical protein
MWEILIHRQNESKNVYEEIIFTHSHKLFFEVVTKTKKMWIKLKKKLKINCKRVIHGTSNKVP